MALLTANERGIAEGVDYYLSIGATWCFIQKQYKALSRRELERLAALYREEQINNVRTDVDTS